MSVKKNQRRHRRIPWLNPIRISWEENSEQRYSFAKCIDISETGIRIEIPQPIPRGTIILLQSERIKLSGAATVRHIVRHGAKYLLGLELSQALLGDTVAKLEGRPSQPSL